LGVTLAAFSFIAIIPPPIAAIAAEREKTMMRARVALIPIEVAAGSLPRSASSTRPVVPSRTAITTIDTITNTMRHNTRKLRSL
jgi:hypothetical protein